MAHKKGNNMNMYNMKRGEDTEQIGVIEWANWNRNRFPELRLLFHIPNGGKRSKTEAAIFKAMGVKAGVPDLCLPVARGGFAGLYIEMKYGKNKPTDNQKQWIADLKSEGYKVEVCYSGEEATRTLEAYLQQSSTILTDPMSEPCKPQKRIEIYCSSEDTEQLRTALQAAVMRGECIFGQEFAPKDCTDPADAEDCAACVLKNVNFVEYD